MKFAVLDTETTGVRPGEDRIIELYAALYDDDGLAEDLRWFVNPCVPIPPEASAVNGITDEDVAGMNPLDAFSCDALLGLLDRADGPIYAHNAPFDRAMIVGEFKRLECHDLAERLEALPWICTLKISREIWPGDDNRLGAVAARLDIQPSGDLHRASVDVDLLARVIPELVQRYAYRASNGALVKVAPPAGELVTGQDLLVDATNRAATFTARVQAAAQWADAFVVESDDDEADGHEALGRVKKLTAEADAARKAVVEPIKSITTKIDALFRDQIAKPSAQAMATIEGQLNRYAAGKLRKQREVEAEARKRLEAAQAEARRVQQASGQPAEAVDAAVAAVNDAYVEIVAAVEVGPQAVKTAAASGGYKTRWVARISDPARVPDVFWRPDLELVQRAVDQGAREIAGCEITEEVIVSNRRKG